MKITKRIALCTLALFFLALQTAALAQRQRDPRPRRLENPETIQLNGGRVEFRTFHSPSLNREMRYSVLIPPSYDASPDKKYPVVYFLHGMFNDDTSWCVERYGNLPPRIDDLMVSGEVPEFLMVHPNGEDSFYTDSIDGERPFEQYIATDVVQEVENSFRVRSDRMGQAIGGTSMGGYGALKVALKDPRRFATVVAGSPIVLLGDDPTSSLASPNSRGGQFFSRLFSQVYGNPIDLEFWRKNSLERLAKTADVGDLRILVLYGTADRYNGMIPMEKGVRRFVEILEGRGVPVRLDIVENGNHGWALIVNHLEEVIKSLTQTF